jgi:glycosyltransferase involved in cell wall biosynthesis
MSSIAEIETPQVKRQRIPVLHIIDTLAAAGAERVAVNLVNHLPREKYIPYLCTTRADGPLDHSVISDVMRLRLERKTRLDYDAIVRLRRFIAVNDIRIIHAHSSALFIARLATIGLDRKIFWHAHYGRYALEDQKAYRYRVATSGISGIIAVNREMANWSIRRLGMHPDSVWYIPNLVSLDGADMPYSGLPGVKGARIVCLANFRPEKDHLTLVRAMDRIVKIVPQAHLLLAGRVNDRGYKKLVEEEILALGLQKNISILGERHDVAGLLRDCDIGVLSSSSEGFPMSLLEYGAAGLASVATSVGQCPDILQNGKVGVLVPPSSVDALEAALVSLLRSAVQRRALGLRFKDRVNQAFSTKAVMQQLCEIYDSVAVQA